MSEALFLKVAICALDLLVSDIPYRRLLNFLNQRFVV